MKTIEVVAGIIINDNKVFVAQRAYGKFQGGWEFPGGKIEEGETKEQALMRELNEELEIEVNVGKLIKTIEYTYPDFHLIMHCFLTTIKKGNPNLLVHQNAKWLTKEQLNSINWVPADLEILPEIQTLLH